jgi:hypothetical protein
MGVRLLARDHRGMAWTPRGRRLVVAVLVAAGTLSLGAGPAGAHAGDAERATNYQTTITSVPDLPGLTVGLADAGSTIEVTYHGPGELIVHGYSNASEPYLRIGADGVFRNRQSHATYVNDSLTADTPIPPDVDPENPPEWERVSDRPTYRWHDHRAHWMGAVDPPEVAAAPGQEHVVIDDWRIPITVDGVPAEIRGDVTWIPGASPGPWVAVIALGTIVVAAVGTASARGLAVAAGLLAGLGCTSIVAGLARSPVDPPAWWLAGGLVTVGVLAAAVLVLATGRVDVGAALAGAGALSGGFLFGLVDRSWLVRSLLPVDLSPAVARGLVAAGAAVGAGLVVASAVTLLRRAGPVRTPGPAPPVDGRPDPRIAPTS